VTSPSDQTEPGRENKTADLDARILRIAEAIGRHIAREDFARLTSAQNEIMKQETDLDESGG